MKLTYYLTFLATALLTSLTLYYFFFAAPNEYWIWLGIGALFNGFLAWQSYQQLSNQIKE